MACTREVGCYRGTAFGLRGAMAVLLGVLVACGLAHGWEVRASSVPCDLEIHGTLSGDLPSLTAAQAIGLDLATDRWALEADLLARWPTESDVRISAVASLPLLNSDNTILDQALDFRATLNARLSILPDTQLDVGLNSEARWGAVSARVTSQVDAMEALGLRDGTAIGGHASFVGEVDLLDLLLEEGGRQQLRMVSVTRLDARESGVSGQQSFEAALAGVMRSWSSEAAERRTLEGALTLNASVLPSAAAEARLRLTSRDVANRLEGCVEADVDHTGVQRVMVWAGGESELSGEFGTLSMSFRADCIGWSRGEAGGPSFRLGLEARLDPAGSGPAEEGPQTRSGTTWQVSADVLMDQTGVQLTVGGELSFGWRLLERETGEDVNQPQIEPRIERGEGELDPDQARR